MTIRFRTLILFPLLWLISLLASGQDTAKHKFTVYYRLPFNPFFQKENQSYLRFASNQEIGIGYHPTNKSEWCAILEYIPLQNNVYSFHLTYDPDHIKNISVKSPVSGFNFRMQFDKRWFLFRKKMLRPFGGISVTTIFTKENDVGITQFSDPDQKVFYAQYSVRASGLSAYLGLNIGVHFHSKRWAALAVFTASNKFYSVTKANHGLSATSYYYRIFSTGIQLGYSF